MLKLIATAGLALVLAAPTSASALTRPSFGKARRASQIVFRDYVGIMDGKLVLGACDRRGRLSVVCRVRIVGPVRSKYRVIVTSITGGVSVRAREVK